MADNINITAEPAKKLPITLVGKAYVCTVPKKALALALSVRFTQADEEPQLVSEALDALVLKMFGKKVAPEILERLASGEDDLDVDHIMKLMNALITEASGGDPTTSPSVSTTTP